MSAFLALWFIGFVLLLARRYRRVEQGQVLVVSTPQDVHVSFKARLILPVIHRVEVMDITMKTLEIVRTGQDGLRCRDMRADVKVSFFLRVNPTDADVLAVAQSLGCARASDPEAVQEIFEGVFWSAIRSVARELDFADIDDDHEAFIDRVMEHIGPNLNGFVVDHGTLDRLSASTEPARDWVSDVEVSRRVP